MKNSVEKFQKFQIFSSVFTFVLGTLLHFTYEMSGNNKIVGLFSSVNESTWEHLKLLFFPMLITAIIGQIYIGKEKPNYLCAKVVGIISSMLFTIVFFYTYTGVLGKNIAFIDITSFFISAIIGEYIVNILLKRDFKCNNKIAKIILVILAISFLLFTFNPPKIGLFKDPLTGTYGIQKELDNI